MNGPISGIDTEEETLATCTTAAAASSHHNKKGAAEEVRKAGRSPVSKGKGRPSCLLASLHNIIIVIIINTAVYDRNPCPHSSAPH